MKEFPVRRPRSSKIIVAVLFLFSWLTVAVPAHGQEASEWASDPFAEVQRNLNLAADAQINLIRAQAQPGGIILAPAASSQKFERQGTRSLGRNFSARAKKSFEPRFQSMGVDAGSIFTELGVPVEFLAIAQVESNFNPAAHSPKGALGLWQLMPYTARRYGLRVDGDHDERADPEKATRAAARYLRDLHTQFGDWLLALAAYNAGEDLVQTAVERAGTTDYWSLSNARKLPQETRNYVPAVLAAMRLSDNSGTSFGQQHTARLNTKGGVLFALSSVGFDGAATGDSIPMRTTTLSPEGR